MIVRLVQFGKPMSVQQCQLGDSVKDCLVRSGVDYTSVPNDLSVNGAPATLDTPLREGDLLQLAPRVKGGLN